MSDLPSSMARIERSLVSLGRVTLIARLRPGRDADDIRARLGELGIAATNDIVQVLGWHDGTDGREVATSDELQLVPGFYLLSLADACADYLVLRDDARWKQGWFPLLANGGDDFYIVDLSESSQGLIRHFRIDESDHPVEFDSLSDMMATFAEALDVGVFSSTRMGTWRWTTSSSPSWRAA